MRMHFAVGLFTIGAALAVALTPAVRRLAWRLDIVDRPSDRRTRAQGVMPQLGGLALFGACWLALAGVALAFPDAVGRAALGERLDIVAAALGAGAAMLLIGALDDWRGLSPRVKLLAALAMAVALVAGGVGLGQGGLAGAGSRELYWLAAGVSVVWIAGVTHAVNLVDGVDGLASGACGVIALATALVAGLHGHLPAALIAAAFAGGCAGFLVFNFSPASIFLGDSGSLLAGATLAVLALASVQGAEGIAGLAMPLLLLGYPTADTCLVTLRRLLTGKSIFVGDRTHLHHRLLYAGCTPAQAALILYGVALAFCLPAIGLASGNRAVVGAGGVLLVGMVAFGVRRLGWSQGCSPRALWRQRPHYRMLHHRTRLAAAELALAKDVEEAVTILEHAAPHYGVVRLEVAFGQAAPVNEPGPVGGPASASAPPAEGDAAAHARQVSHATPDERVARQPEPPRRRVIYPLGERAYDRLFEGGCGARRTNGAAHGRADVQAVTEQHADVRGHGAFASAAAADMGRKVTEGAGAAAASDDDKPTACVSDTFWCPRARLGVHVVVACDASLDVHLQMERRTQFNALLREFARRLRAIVRTGSAPAGGDGGACSRVTAAGRAGVAPAGDQRAAGTSRSRGSGG